MTPHGGARLGAGRKPKIYKRTNFKLAEDVAQAIEDLKPAYGSRVAVVEAAVRAMKACQELAAPEAAAEEGEATDAP